MIYYYTKIQRLKYNYTFFIFNKNKNKIVILLLFRDVVITFTKISLYLIYINKYENIVKNNLQFYEDNYNKKEKVERK